MNELLLPPPRAELAGDQDRRARVALAESPDHELPRLERRVKPSGAAAGGHDGDGRVAVAEQVARAAAGLLRQLEAQMLVGRIGQLGPADQSAAAARSEQPVGGLVVVLEPRIGTDLLRHRSPRVVDHPVPFARDARQALLRRQVRGHRMNMLDERARLGQLEGQAGVEHHADRAGGVRDLVGQTVTQALDQVSDRAVRHVVDQHGLRHGRNGTSRCRRASPWCLAADRSKWLRQGFAEPRWHPQSCNWDAISSRHELPRGRLRWRSQMRQDDALCISRPKCRTFRWLSSPATESRN